MLNLLDDAYGASDDPFLFDDFLKQAGLYFFGSLKHSDLAADIPKYADIDPHLDRHVERLERLIQEKKPSDTIGLSLDQHAIFTLSAAGQVISANAYARALMSDIEGAWLNNLPLSSDSTDILRASVRDLAAGVKDNDRIIYLQVEADEYRPAFGFCRTATDPKTGEDALQVSLSYFEWSPRLFAGLQSALALTDRETEVLTGVLLGQSHKEIARARNRSVDTIKAQSKSVLRKAGVAKMTDLAHLCTSIAYVIGLSDVAMRKSPTGPDDWVTPRQNLRMSDMGKGRQLAWYEYGDPDGRPVIYFHGFFQGPFFPDHIKKRFLADGLRIIAPSRPGMGYSSPPGAFKRYRDTANKDVLTLLDMLGIQDNIVIAAHHGGSVHAFKTARALGERLSAMALLGIRLPITQQHFAKMNHNTRIVSAASRHAPSVSKMIVTLGIKAAKERGMQSFLENQYAPSEIDQLCLNDPEAVRLMREGLYHVVEQGANGFVYDSRANMTDWSDDLTAVSCRQFWLHGRHCHVMGAGFVEDHVRTTSNHDVRIHEDAGFNLMFQKPDSFADTIRNAATSDITNS